MTDDKGIRDEKPGRDETEHDDPSYYEAPAPAGFR